MGENSQVPAVNSFQDHFRYLKMAVLTDRSEAIWLEDVFSLIVLDLINVGDDFSTDAAMGFFHHELPPCFQASYASHKSKSW